MIVKNLLLKEFRHLRWIIVTGIVINCGTALIIAGSYYFLKKLLGEIPAETLVMLREIEFLRGFLSIFDDYSYYIWSQWNAKNLFQMAALLAIIIAATQYAGEAGRKTMSFLLSRPVNRRQVFTAKSLAAILILLSVFLTGTTALFLYSRFFGYRPPVAQLTTACLITLLWVYVYYLLGSMVSICCSESLPAGVAIGLCGLALSIPGLFEKSRPYSIFYRMKAVDYFLFERSPLGSIAAALVLTGLLFFAALKVFKARDY